MSSQGGCQTPRRKQFLATHLIIYKMKKLQILDCSLSLYKKGQIKENDGDFEIDRKDQGALGSKASFSYLIEFQK